MIITMAIDGDGVAVLSGSTSVSDLNIVASTNNTLPDSITDLSSNWLVENDLEVKNDIYVGNDLYIAGEIAGGVTVGGDITCEDVNVNGLYIASGISIVTNVITYPDGPSISITDNVVVNGYLNYYSHKGSRFLIQRDY